MSKLNFSDIEEKTIIKELVQFVSMCQMTLEHINFNEENVNYNKDNNDSTTIKTSNEMLENHEKNDCNFISCLNKQFKNFTINGE